MRAAAAGVDRAAFSKSTLSEILIQIEGAKERAYWTALPTITSILSQVSDESLNKKDDKPPNPKRQELRDQMLEPYAPSYMTLLSKINAKDAFEAKTKNFGDRKVIEGLAPSAARGIVQLYDELHVDVKPNSVWLSVYRHWSGIRATSEQSNG